MLAVSLAMTLAAVAGPGPGPKTGQDVIRAMHEKYAKTWYRQLSFVQRAIFPGKPEEEWWEAMKIPGRLRIDVAPVDSGVRSVIYRGDSLYVFADRKLANQAVQPNLLLVLGFDVYGQPPESTVALLEREHFDLGKVHEETWEGRPAYVVGAAQGDGQSNQFWIDKERLVFVRLIEQRPKGGPADIRFTKYERLGGGWIGTEVHFFSGGKESFTEIYRDWKVNPAVTDDLFDVKEWKRPAWVPKR
jgi:hypothetical protein